MSTRTYWVYILTNRSGTLYVGMTSDLGARIEQHRLLQRPAFTARYRIIRLVYAELYEDVRDAIARERQLKGWTRRKKVALINSTNPSWRDMSHLIV